MIRYRNLLQNSRAFRLFLGDLSRGANHCYLLVSGDSAALTELVRLMAAALHCEADDRPCLRCAECRRYEELAGGNVLLYPKGDRIRRDDIQDLLRNISYKSFERGDKVAVLRDADRMDANTQNKLLKTLEEPPAGVVFFLLAANAEKLLPTVRSRVRILELELFPRQAVYAELASRLGESERLRKACICAGGRPGLAERFYGDPAFERTLAFTEEVLHGLRAQRDFVAFSSRFDEIKGDYERFLDLLQIFLRDSMTRGIAEPMGMGAEELADIAPERLAEGIEYINLCKKKIVSNCNTGAAYQMLLVKLTEIIGGKICPK